MMTDGDRLRDILGCAWGETVYEAAERVVRERDDMWKVLASRYGAESLSAFLAVRAQSRRFLETCVVEENSCA
jgi:hypothetical protein